MQIRLYKTLAIITCIFFQVAVIGQVKANDVLTILANIDDPEEFESSLSIQKLSDIDYYSLMMKLCSKDTDTNNDIVKTLVKRLKADTGFSDYDYQVIIYELLYQDKESCSIMLLDNLNNLDSYTPMGETLLHQAVLTQRESLVKELLRKKADVDIFDSQNKKPIGYAIDTENLTIFEMLLPLTDLDDNVPNSDRSLYHALKFLIEYRREYNGWAQADAFTELLEAEYSLRMIRRRG